MVELIDMQAYLKRSFCIAELHASIDGKAEIWINGDLDIEGTKLLLDEHPIDAELAQSLHDEDKQQIDSFIQLTTSFKRLNRQVTETLFHGLVHYTGSAIERRQAEADRALEMLDKGIKG